MNQLRRVVVAIWLSWIGGTTASWAQPAPAGQRQAPLPLQLKTAATLTPADIATINSTVAGNFAAMLDPSPATQQQAREALIMDARAAGNMSRAFSDAYAQAIVTNITADSIAKARSMRVRLNAVVALARISESLRNPKLEPAVLMYLGEDQPYVLRLWAVKAAKGILPELANANATQKVLAAVLSVVRKHATGAVAAEAYNTLEVASPPVIDTLLDVIDLRVQQYRKGLPEDPEADIAPFAFFSKSSTWSVLSPAQRVRVMQAFCDLMVLAAYHGDAQPPGPGPREQLRELVLRLCGSLMIVAKPELAADKNLEDAADRANRAAMPAGANLTAAIKPLPAAIKNVKGMSGVTEPKLVPPPSTNPVVVSS